MCTLVSTMNNKNKHIFIQHFHPIQNEFATYLRDINKRYNPNYIVRKQEAKKKKCQSHLLH